MAQKHNSEYTEAPMTTFGPEQGPNKRYRRLRHPSFDADVWTAKNPLLQKGELGVETDTSKVKIGDGVTFWNDLPYMFDDAGANTDLSNLSATGKANVSAQGTYDANATYTAGTVGAAIKGKANTDLDNLTSTGANIANWSSNVTNCITEIPQDINLTLSDGTLTLKAGSKVYVPNGAGVFEQKTVSEDKTITNTANGAYFAFTNANASAFTYVSVSNTCSGSTDALAGTANHCWYDTTNNVINYYGADGTTVAGTRCLPVALFTVSGGQISSIDQVFNGFGYIGSTVFTLPGVKGLYPNGRNADGTLKNGLVNCTSVQISSNFTDSDQHCLLLNTNGRCQWYNRTQFSYDNQNNIVYSYNGTKIYVIDAGTFDTTSGVISNFNPKTAFHAVDYNESDYIANCAMPSGRYTDLTLGNDNDPLTAPADGYYMLSKTSGATGERVGFQGRVDAFVYSSDSGQGLAVYMPVRKDDTVSVRFTATGTTNRFRFIYANGAK